MHLERLIHWLLFPHFRMEAWRIVSQFLMAGRREEEGTPSLPPFFPYNLLGLRTCFATSGLPSNFAIQTNNFTPFLMAGRDGAQGTALLPPYHLPVLTTEILHWMNPNHGDRIIDGTLGGGGHSELFLKNGASVLGIDRDPDALHHASQRFTAYSETFHPWQANYAEMPQHPMLSDGQKADGILLDLGVSSHQLDCAERGFSFQKDGPLDMRMGPDGLCTAADFVNQSSESELTDCFRSLGEEPQALRIARLIVQKRATNPFTRTLQLAQCIEALIGRHGKTHPATRCFQAIRMHINQEIPMLHRALLAALSCLKPGGKLLIITFHSLEDTIVKKFLHHHASSQIDDPTWPAAKPNPDYFLSLPIRKSIAPTREEIRSNPRARSAKLRIAQRNSNPLIVTP